MIPDEFYSRMKKIQSIHQHLYDSGRGWIVGKLILLLTHTGRKSGKIYHTPLQYEWMYGSCCVGSARGRRSDWFRNLQADPYVEVAVGRRKFTALAETVTDPERIADFLEYRLKHRPLMMGLMMKLQKLPFRPTREQLLKEAPNLAMAVLRPLEQTLELTRSGYDAVAEQYAQEMFTELDHKPRDRELLQEMVNRVGDLGPICDIGCGPGEIARFLKDQGASVLGVDLSPQMVAVASCLSPDIPFHQGNMLCLDFPDASWGGITAFYTIIHIPRPQVMDALREFLRLLKPSGTLLLTFHIGSMVEHVSEWWGNKVALDFAYYETADMDTWLRTAGFEDIQVNLREPYPDVEVQTRRAYIFARKPHAPR